MTEQSNDKKCNAIQDLYLATFEYQWPQDKQDRPFSIYWTFLTVDPTNPDGSELFVGDDGIDISPHLVTLIRVGRIKDMEKFTVIVREVRLIETGVPYEPDEVMRHYQDVPYDDGRAWVVKTLYTLRTANRFGDIFEGAKLRFPELTFQAALSYTEEKMASGKKLWLPGAPGELKSDIWLLDKLAEGDMDNTNL